MVWFDRKSVEVFDDRDLTGNEVRYSDGGDLTENIVTYGDGGEMTGEEQREGYREE